MSGHLYTHMSPNFKSATESIAQVAESLEKDAKDGKERQEMWWWSAWLEEEGGWVERDIGGVSG